MKNVLVTWVWWKAALIRALRTALAVVIPYVPASYIGDVPYITMASAAAMGFIFSIITSLAGIPEVEGRTEQWYFAILSRVVKTVGQALLAGIGTAVLITDVDWAAIWQMSLTAGFASLVMAVLAQLPEAEKPTAQATVTTVVVNERGTTEQAVPVVTSVDSADALDVTTDTPDKR